MVAGVASTTYCEAEFNYQDGVSRRTVRQSVANGRVSDRPDFDVAGFDLIDHRSSVVDWSDGAEVGEVNSAEVEQLALDYIACDEAMAYPALLRSRELATEVPDHGPIEFVHSDFTEDYGDMIADPSRPYSSFVGPLLASRGLSQGELRHASRVMILQFWRNTGPVRPDLPLAVCDGSTIDESRLHRFVVEEYGGVRLAFEVFAVGAPPSGDQDAWYCFPEMTADEVIAIRTYDSRCIDEGRSFWTPHSAFRDPNADPGAERRSVERRVLCVWR